jgi:hypothetical protein
MGVSVYFHLVTRLQLDDFSRAEKSSGSRILNENGAGRIVINYDGSQDYFVTLVCLRRRERSDLERGRKLRDPGSEKSTP